MFFINVTERTLSASSPAANSITSAPPPAPAASTVSPQSAGVVKSESTNFREMAEQRRLEFLRKKADSSPRYVLSCL
mgnify:CR=1 FL=1